MTRIMDRLFLSTGIPCEDLGSVQRRGILYMGMIFMAGVATAFGVMALFGG